MPKQEKTKRVTASELADLVAFQQEAQAAREALNAATEALAQTPEFQAEKAALERVQRAERLLQLHTSRIVIAHDLANPRFQVDRETGEITEADGRQKDRERERAERHARAHQ